MKYILLFLLFPFNIFSQPGCEDKCESFQIKLVPLDTALCDCLAPFPQSNVTMGIVPNNWGAHSLVNGNGFFVATIPGDFYCPGVEIGFTLRQTCQLRCFRFQVQTKWNGDISWTVHPVHLCIFAQPNYTYIAKWGEIGEGCVIEQNIGYLTDPANKGFPANVQECGLPCPNFPPDCQ